MVKKLIVLLVVFISVNILNYNVYCYDAPDATNTPSTLDQVITGARNFLTKGNEQINEEELHSTSNFIFNVLLACAMVVAVVVGMIIGIQFMTASTEEKAKVKESLVPYVVGCVVVFGAFGIWKLVVNVLSTW